MKANRLVLISGCSGGGKSTLLEELRKRGHCVVEEPGGRIIRADPRCDAVPWRDLQLFLRRAIEIAQGDLQEAEGIEEWVFFDRGLIDAASALERITGEPLLEELCPVRTYHRSIFMVPPWPEIYQVDESRRHGFDAAIAEYRRLSETFPALGYEMIHLPKTSVSTRADFVLASLAECG